MAVSASGSGPAVRTENFATGDSLSSYGHSPADTVSVTYVGCEHRHAVITRTGLNSLISSDIATLNESSSPAEILSAQLDFITEARGGMLSRFVKCATLLALLLHACVMGGSVWLRKGLAYKRAYRCQIVRSQQVGANISDCHSVSS
jgi:hypothetical protein